jgi:hypothetical protein
MRSPGSGGVVSSGRLKVKGLVAGCHSFCLFFIFFVTYIHTFIQSHSYNTFIDLLIA